jgi:hypothetical protein
MANSTVTWPLFGQLAKLCGQLRTLAGYRRDRQVGAHSLRGRASLASPSLQRGGIPWKAMLFTKVAWNWTERASLSTLCTRRSS